MILMCGAASRAAFAADALYRAGFEQVFIQVEGFEGVKAESGRHKGKRSVVAGWKYEGLPWSYELITEKMYFNFDPKKQVQPAANAE